MVAVSVHQPTTRAAGGPRVAVLTMVRDEARLLPRWVAHYGRHVGVENLVVLDDNSTDGSTDDLPCTTYRLPPPPWKQGWGSTRQKLVNGLAKGLLACNDVVVFTDVDEFLLPDPAKHDGLLDYLAARADRRIVAPLALEVLHNARVEGALHPDLPLLDQRRFVKFSPGMCKPLVKRVPQPWQHAFHGMAVPFEVDRDLWMLHLKYADVEWLETSAEQRRSAFEQEGRGHPGSFWPLGAEALTQRLAGWTEAADATGSVPVFDPAEARIDDLVRKRTDGRWQARFSQVKGLEKSPLREIPARLRGAF